jgi:hypothetical protein
MTSFGPRPSPGTYYVREVDDPLFGPVALVVPAAAGAGGAGFHPNASWDWGNRPPAGAGGVGFHPNASWDWGNRPPAGSAGASQSNVWCLSGNPVPGGNSMRVLSGFAEFISALRGAGQVTLTVR